MNSIFRIDSWIGIWLDWQGDLKLLLTHLLPWQGKMLEAVLHLKKEFIALILMLDQMPLATSMRVHGLLYYCFSIHASLIILSEYQNRNNSGLII